MILVALFRLLFIVLVTLVAAPVAIVLAPLDAQARAAYRVAVLWARAILAVSGVRLRVRMLGRLDPRRAYIFMSNHESHFDALVLVAALVPFQLRWVAKKELRRIPFFGWALAATHNIIIDRSDRAQAFASLARAREQVEAGISVVIFPEGTRSVGGELLPFKKGGFFLAVDTGAPIVPVALAGSAAILPKGGWRIRGGEVEVTVGPPLAISGEGAAERERLLAAVRDFIARHRSGAVDQRPAAHGALVAERPR